MCTKLVRLLSNKFLLKEHAKNLFILMVLTLGIDTVIEMIGPAPADAVPGDIKEDIRCRARAFLEHLMQWCGGAAGIALDVEILAGSCPERGALDQRRTGQG